MNGKELWRRWRHDIVRSTVIFGVVVGVGLAILSMVNRGRARLSDLQRTFDGNFNARDRQHAEPWVYTATLPAKATVWLRDINGDISVEPAEGQTVEVRADRSFRHASTDSVRLLTSVTDSGLTVCAVWPSASTACGPDGHYKTEGMRHGNDVAVSFTVRLPRGIGLDASTVNGDIDVRGAAAPVGATTVNGDVSVETGLGPVRAVTVNGDVNATMDRLAPSGDVKVTTVRGDVTLRLPDDLDAVVSGHTVTGDITSEFPLSVTGKFASHSLLGTLGRGGRRVQIETVAGDIDLRKVTAGAVAPAAPPALPKPARPTARVSP